MEPPQGFAGNKQFLMLLESIYSAIDDASLWPAVLDSLGEAVRSEGVLLFAGFKDTAVNDIVASARMDERVLVPYAQYYATVNVLASRCDQVFPDGTVRYSHIAVPDREFDNTEFCNDYFAPNQMYYSFGIKIPIQKQASAYLSLMRTRQEGPFEECDGTVLSTLMPHLQRALNLHLRFSELRSHAAGLEHALDSFELGVFGLNSAGYVVFANRTALDITRAENGISLKQGRLTAENIHPNAQLQVLLSAAVSTGTRKGTSSGGSLLIDRRSGGPAFQLNITPFRCTSTNGYRELVALVFLNDSSRMPLERSGALRSLYGLSPSESRLADLLAAGLNITEAADRMRLTIDTARFHLKSVFRKTGTNRQASLVRLVLSLPGVL